MSAIANVKMSMKIKISYMCVHANISTYFDIFFLLLASMIFDSVCNIKTICLLPKFFLFVLHWQLCLMFFAFFSSFHSIAYFVHLLSLHTSQQSSQRTSFFGSQFCCRQVLPIPYLLSPIISFLPDSFFSWHWICDEGILLTTHRNQDMSTILFRVSYGGIFHQYVMFIIEHISIDFRHILKNCFNLLCAKWIFFNFFVAAFPSIWFYM